MRYQKCPICDGVGQVSGGYYDRAGDCNEWVSDKTIEMCRQCNGTGMIIAPDWGEPYYPNSSYHYATLEDRCPACGQLRTEPSLTGCPKGSHYGTQS